ncbi:efflux RND transporter permease subunit [Campylobacter rectus]
MKRIFKFIVTFPKSVIAGVLTATLFFGYFSGKLEVDASTETLLLENDKDLAVFRDVFKRYVSPNYLVVAYTPKDDILAPATLEKIKNLSDELAKNELVSNVISILNIPLLQSGSNELGELVKHVPSLADADINKTLVRREFGDSPLYTNNIVSGDLKTTAIVLNLKTDEKYQSILNERNALLNAKLDGNITSEQKQRLSTVNARFKTYRDEARVKEHAAIEQIRKAVAKFSGEESLFLGGANMIADDMVGFVRSDLASYGISVTLLLIFSLWLFFRQIRYVFMPIFICVISVIWASGLFGFFGWEITVISSNYIALQLIITISVVIHLIVSYREFYLTKPHLSNSQLVYLTLRDKASPSFFAIFTTVIGFLSLALSDIKPIIMLGVMMSASIAVSLALAFLLFGSAMTLMPKLAPVRTFESKFGFTKYCAKFALEHGRAVYMIALAVLIFGLYGISKLRVENSFISYFKDTTEIHKGMQVIDTKLGGTVPVDILIKFNKPKFDKIAAKNEPKDEFDDEFAANANEDKYWFNQHKIDVAKKVHNYLENKRFVGHVSSMGTIVKIVENITRKPIDGLMLSILYEQIPQKYKYIILSPYVSIKDNELRFTARTLDSDDALRRDEFLRELRTDITNLTANDNASVQVSGAMVLYNNLLQSLIVSQVDSFGFVVLALFVVFCIIFRSVKLAVIAIISNLIPLCAVFGVMGALGIPLDIMSITIAAISIGIGVDDIIHYIHRLKIELRSRNVAEAIKASHASIGYAMYYTSFAVILGFSIMVTSNFIPTIYFGLLTDLVMIMMLLGALVLLPTLISTFYRVKIPR